MIYTAILLIALIGDNHEHLNSPGIQISVAPVLMENLETCEKLKPLVVREVEAKVQKLISVDLAPKNPWEHPLKIMVSGTCRRLDG